MFALVDNAISHSPEGATVEVTVQREDDWARSLVADNGTGIDPEDIARLTQRLARERLVTERAWQGCGWRSSPRSCARTVAGSTSH